jgi:hypothetical protein
LSPKGFAAVSALSFLITTAVQEDVISPSKASAHLCKYLFLQLRQSGFTGALPRLLDILADSLATTQNVPASQLAEVPQTLSYVYMSGNSPAATPITPSSSSSLIMHAHGMQDLASFLLLLVRNFLSTWQQRMDKEALATRILRLCAAALQHSSRCADAYPAVAPSPPTALQQLVSSSMVWRTSDLHSMGLARHKE